jgi:hypothetical protein
MRSLPGLRLAHLALQRRLRSALWGVLRHSAGGKKLSIAAKHYLGRSDRYLRDVVDEAFAPYAAMVSPDGGAQGATLRAVTAGATG